MTGDETMADAQRAILLLEQDWAAAIQRRDAAAMEHFLADSYFLGIGVQGQSLQVAPRAAWLGNLPQYVTESFRVDDAQVRVYGDVAVVLMLYTQKAVVRGQDRSGQFVIAEFIRSNDFATLVSFDGERPVATHLPLGLEDREDNSIVLTGHMARANRQWHSFDPTQEVLAVFSGPQAYISPRWYNHVNVPTWNYIAVHAYGRPRVMTDHDELYRLLETLVDKHEADSGAVPAYGLESLPADFRERQMQAIVGFQIGVTRIEASYKLSQNRDEQGYDNVITEMYRRTDDNSLSVADVMKNRRSKLFGGD